MRIAIFNTYDISPGENGGEIRSQNIYCRLSRTEDVRFLSYDLRCTTALAYGRLEPSLRTVTAEVAHGDRYAFFTATERMGLFAHDVLCAGGYDFSPAFLGTVRASVDWAQVVVVLQPYLAPLVFPMCGHRQLKVFEAHNIEGRVKTEFFEASRDPELSIRFVQDTCASESLALEQADTVLAVSDADADGFVEDYGASRSKIRVVPNGVSVGSFERIPADARSAFRRDAGLSELDVGVFLGSAYGPNVDSYLATRQWLDRANFVGCVLVVGRIADVDRTGWPPVRFAEHWLGFIDEAAKQLVVGAADFALQIMTAGGGTNLKLFDYMASGVPILANRFGARGVAECDWYIPVETAEDMLDVVARKAWKGSEAIACVHAAQQIVRRDFDWDRIAERYRRALG